MRLIAIAALSVLVSCGSFGSSSDTEPSPDGGQNVDGAAGSEAGLDGGADAPLEASSPPMKTCADRPGAILCADFEGQSPFFGWEDRYESTGSQVLVVPDASRGSNVMRSVLAAGPPVASAQIARPLPTTSTSVFVRVYVRFDASPADTDYHILLVLSNIEIGIENGGLLVNRFGAGAQTFYEPASKAFPIGKWACVEWALDANSTKLSVDGELVHSKASPMDLAQSIVVGFRHASTTTAPTMVAYDDLVVAKQPIGCD